MPPRCRRMDGWLALDPTLPDAHFGLGQIAHRQGDLQRALRHYRQALQQAPGQRRYRTNLAGLLLDLGDFPAALAEYENLLSAPPRPILTRLDAGKAARRAGDLKRALEHHEQLLRDLAGSDPAAADDDAAEWIFGTGATRIIIDSAERKRAYIGLTVALTRDLAGDPDGAAALLRALANLPEQPRALDALDRDRALLTAAQPGWAERIDRFRRRLDAGDVESRR